MYASELHLLNPGIWGNFYSELRGPIIISYATISERIIIRPMMHHNNLIKSWNRIPGIFLPVHPQSLYAWIDEQIIFYLHFLAKFSPCLFNSMRTTEIRVFLSPSPPPHLSVILRSASYDSGIIPPRNISGHTMHTYNNHVAGSIYVFHHMAAYMVDIPSPHSWRSPKRNFTLIPGSMLSPEFPVCM